MANYCIGLDWGGTRVKIGAVAPDGALLDVDAFDRPRQATIDANVAVLLDAVANLVERMGAKPRGMGLALTGPVDPDSGVVHLPGKIQGLEGYPLVRAFRDRFDIPVRAENDGKVALFAERAYGKMHDVDWGALLTLGTGVGSGVLLEGRIPDDPRFLFGTQAGHLVIDASHDALCLTGARGTGEQLCSATALALAVRDGLHRGIPSVLAERYWNDPASIDFEAVIREGVEAGDRLCCDALERWTRRLGWLVVSVVHAYAARCVVLAGGATAAADHFMDALREHVDAHAFRYPPDAPIPVLASELGGNAGVLGAATLIREHLGPARAES